MDANEEGMRLLAESTGAATDLTARPSEVHTVRQSDSSSAWVHGTIIYLSFSRDTPTVHAFQLEREMRVPKNESDPHTD